MGFEDDIDWSRTGIVLPKGVRARVRRTTSVAPATASASGTVEATSSHGEKRCSDGIVGIEGQIRGQKHGRYILELPDNAGARPVAAEHLQPLLTQQQAERLLAATPTAVAAIAGASRSTSAIPSSSNGS